MQGHSEPFCDRVRSDEQGSAAFKLDDGLLKQASVLSIGMHSTSGGP